MTTVIDPGNKRKLTAAFSDPDDSDAPVPPTSVYLDIRDPDGEVTTYQYDVDDIILSPSIGSYTASISFDTPGNWFYRWYSTNPAASKENMISVRQTTTY